MDDARAGAQSDVDRLLGNLGPLPDPRQRPALLVLSGLPGSGKSYFCRKLTELLPVVVLETDALRKVLFEHPTHDGAENARLFRAVHRVLERLLMQNQGVALDATNLIRRDRRRLYRIAEDQGAALAVARMVAPEPVIRQRLRERIANRQSQLDDGDGSDAGIDVYDRMKRTEQAITREHIVVDSSTDITPALADIVVRLGQSSSPTLQRR